jgi:hypothetical protein
MLYIPASWFQPALVPRIVALPCGLALLLLCSCSQSERGSGALAQEAYIWQRAWNQPVREAAQKQAAQFAGLVCLAAEVTWKGAQPDVVRVPVDFGSLTNAKHVGLALRIGVFDGSHKPNDHAAHALSQLASDMVAQARSNGLHVAEFQLDFDCAEAKLDAYRVWARAVAEAVRPVPLTITVLPSWLEQRALKPLLAGTVGFVLQVHSLARPRDARASFSLCEPKLAMAAVERASRLGVPFRVALPTYGYTLAFSPAGNFIGLSAEGPKESWPRNSILRQVQADPQELAGLVRMWTRSRPAMMRGLIWYRMPVAADDLNWSWATLVSVMEGKVPHWKLQPILTRPDGALVEIDVVNSGTGDYEGPVKLAVNWRDGRMLACDGWQGFSADEGNLGQRVQFTKPTTRLRAGERGRVGWVRFEKQADVTIETEP